MTAPTLAQSIQQIAEATNVALDGGCDASAIDWSNVKKLLAKFIENFGPVILHIVLGFLNSDTTTE